MAQPCGFRGFWFKSLKSHPFLFFCNICFWPVTSVFRRRADSNLLRNKAKKSSVYAGLRGSSPVKRAVKFRCKMGLFFRKKPKKSVFMRVWRVRVLYLSLFGILVDLKNSKLFLWFFAQFWAKKEDFRFLIRKPKNARKARRYAVFEQKEKHICLVYKCVFLRVCVLPKGTMLQRVCYQKVHLGFPLLRVMFRARFTRNQARRFWSPLP